MSLDSSIAIIYYNKKNGVELLMFESAASEEIAKLDGVIPVSGISLDKRIDAYIKASNEDNYIDIDNLYTFIDKVEKDSDFTMVKKINENELMEFINWISLTDIKCSIYAETTTAVNE